MTVHIGIDLGGTKIEGVALALDGGELARIRVTTPSGYDASLDAIEALVARIEDEIGARGTLGVGIPGTISPVTGLVKNANSTWLTGRPLDRDLEARLGRPVRLANDANCFALSEAVDGAAAGASNVFGVILGTGVGGGVVIGGRVVPGAQLIGGEWGHNPLPWPTDDERPGPACYCGRSGCLETFLSGPGLERDHATRENHMLSAVEIGSAWRTGDPPAARTIERYIDRLARGLATVVNVLDPEVVVLGGGVSNLPGLADAVRASLSPYVFTDEVTTRVVRNLHGDSSGVRGAAWLWGPGETPDI